MPIFWATPEAQAANPAFVVTVGGEADDNWNGAYDTCAMQQNYVAIIGQLAQDYNIDTSRIYAISLAGGTNAMYQTILANPGLFAAQITTAYDPYHVFKDVGLAEEQFGIILDDMPSWLFAGLSDGSGEGCLGEDDTRMKGERLRDIGYAMNEKGYNIDVGYGEAGEWMWNGLLRGAGGRGSGQRAAGARGGEWLRAPDHALHPRHNPADHALVVERDLLQRCRARLALWAGQRSAHAVTSPGHSQQTCLRSNAGLGTSPTGEGKTRERRQAPFHRRVGFMKHNGKKGRYP